MNACCFLRKSLQLFAKMLVNPGKYRYNIFQIDDTLVETAKMDTKIR